MDASTTLFLLTGPTAVGKTELAIRWAEENNGEIVSADSLLFYRGMDIGTAKPTGAERARVPHHLIDVCEVQEPIDITRYVELARAAVTDIQRRGRKVLVVGGSGFYLKSFFAAVADDVEVPPTVRAEVEAKWKTGGLPALVDELRERNRGELGNLDTANPRRVLRALERCRVSQLTLAELKSRMERQCGPFAEWPTRLCVLERDREQLANRISLRVRAMLAAGLVREVQELVQRGLKQNPSAAKAIGYRETIEFLEGKLAEEKLEALIAQNTRALVKKQRTWFRTQLPPHTVCDAAKAETVDLFPER